jgi:hypothetical protein
MNKILIVAKTKMANEKVCVGGIDLNRLTSVRLFDKDGSHESQTDCPYEIRDIWDIEYIPCPRPLPHSEDVKVINRTKNRVLKQEFSILDVLKKINFQIYTGCIRETFEGKLNCTNSGALYVSGENLPQNSTCFWICNKEIIRHYQRKNKYNYTDDTHRLCYRISYVGLENSIQIIPQNTLVRLSLAHWWSPEDAEDEERCYLQLSGWY